MMVQAAIDCASTSGHRAQRQASIHRVPAGRCSTAVAVSASTPRGSARPVSAATRAMAHVIHLPLNPVHNSIHGGHH